MGANMPADPFKLERFVAAQVSVYDEVRRELQAGSKRSHWIWFIFPQLRGLGRSATAHHYGIASGSEARAYLAHPVLGPRLLECIGLMCAHAGKPLSEIMPFPDNLKFISSMTLFAQVADDPGLFRTALEIFNAGAGDDATMALLVDGE